MFAKLLSTFLIFFVTAQYVSAENIKNARDLDQSFEITKHTNNKKIFLQQMAGGDVADWKKDGQIDKGNVNFKTVWNALQDADRKEQPADTVHVGLKRISEKSNDYLGWIYWDRYYPVQKAVLEPKISLAVFTLNPLEQAIELNSKVTPLTSLVLGQTENFLDFDWAPFHLGPLGRAIGIRTYRVGCGAGGSLCSNELLRLFTIQEPNIREVFISTVGYYGDYGGDWNRDHTRQHLVEELNGILKINTADKNQVPVLVLKAKLRKKWLLRKFVWDKRADGTLHFETNDVEIFPQVHKYESLDDPRWSKH